MVSRLTSPSTVDLPQAIQATRDKLGLSQSQAAQAWDIPLGTLQNYEQGKRKPRDFALKMLEQIIASAETKATSIPSSPSTRRKPNTRRGSKN